MTARARAGVGLAAAALLLAAPPLHAAPTCERAPPAAGLAGTAAAAWPAPLDRRVSLHARDVSLRSALDRLAAGAHVRLSYSGELLPLSRRVCVAYDGVELGDALRALLQGSAVEPVVVAADHVVLAPGRGAAAAVPRDADEVPTLALDRIVVTGSAAGTPQRAVPVALEVIRSAQLARASSAGSVAQVLNSLVPGVWVWEPSPTSALLRYGSVRGASSFGLSYPKVFIDGIEVANPLLAAQFAPESVERIEVIRGPQGAALYGTDAISGVINVVSRTAGTADGAPRLSLRSDVGLAQTAYAPRAALAQEHALALQAGSGGRSLALSLAAGRADATVPDGYTRHLTASGSARRVGARTIVTGTARFYAADARVPENPLLPALPAGMPGMPGAPGAGNARPAADSARAEQAVRQYTLGGSLTYLPGERWTHTLVAGLDGARLDGVPETGTLLADLIANTTTAPPSQADRLTLRLGSTARLGEAARASATLLLGAEHAALREALAAGVAASGTSGWQTSTAALAQLTTGLRDAAFLTGGVRLERHEGPRARSQLAALPVLGASLVGGRGDLSLKLRAAYGEGIRPVSSATRGALWPGSRTQTRLADLAPEEQAGVEAGLDLQFGRALSLQVTRFDQTASGLLQRVPRLPDAPGTTLPRRRHVVYELENVGQIENRGWEAQATASAGRLSLAGGFAQVDSRVRALAEGYTGDLRPGDRMLEVPAQTLSLTAGWAAGGWSGVLTAYRARDWINYDRLALARDLEDVRRPMLPTLGDRLRDYWRRYDGNTRLRASVELRLPRDARLLLTGENLLNHQRGEPDDITVLPGRTLSVGVRAQF